MQTRREQRILISCRAPILLRKTNDPWVEKEATAGLVCFPIPPSSSLSPLTWSSWQLFSTSHLFWRSTKCLINMVIKIFQLCVISVVVIAILASKEDDEKERQARASTRSAVLDVVFGVYTFGLTVFALLGILMALSMIGLDVFKRLRLPIPRPTARYENFWRHCNLIKLIHRRKKYAM